MIFSFCASTIYKFSGVTEGDVAGGREMGEDGWTLHDQADATFFRGNVDGRLVGDGARVADRGAVKFDGGDVGLEQARNRAQQRRLARS